MSTSWNALHGAKIGKKRNSEEEGQDASDVYSHDGAVAAAIGDGVSGAGKLAGYGAKAATAVAARYLAEEFEEIWESDPVRFQRHFKKIIHKVCTTLDAYCRQNDLEPVIMNNRVTSAFRKFATTLIAASVKGNRLILVKIGNGSVAYDYGGAYYLLSPSVIINGETPDITLPAAQLDENLVVERFLLPESVDSLILMSDGVEYSGGLYDAERHLLNNAFVVCMNNLNYNHYNLADILSTIAINNSESEDDVAIAVLYRSSKPASALGNGNPLGKYSLYRRIEYSEESEKNSTNEGTSTTNLVEEDSLIRTPTVLSFDMTTSDLSDSNEKHLNNEQSNDVYSNNEQSNNEQNNNEQNNIQNSNNRHSNTGQAQSSTCVPQEQFVVEQYKKHNRQPIIRLLILIMCIGVIITFINLYNHVSKTERQLNAITVRINEKVSTLEIEMGRLKQITGLLQDLQHNDAQQPTEQ
jgi:hypothetical protein